MAQRGKQNQDQERPTGTSGRQDGINTQTQNPNDAARNTTAESSRTRLHRDDDEDSLLGNRTTNR